MMMCRVRYTGARLPRGGLWAGVDTHEPTRMQQHDRYTPHTHGAWGVLQYANAVDAFGLLCLQLLVAVASVFVFLCVVPAVLPASPT